ncbi:toll/interleukin-1 receptor domain-containing protein [Streptomyces violaceoruber]
MSGVRTEPPTRPVTASSGRLRVLVSHAEADRHWADWVRFELEARGHEVLADPTRTLAAYHLNQECDVVLALFSDAYLDSSAAAPVVSALAGGPPSPRQPPDAATSCSSCTPSTGLDCRTSCGN